MMTTRTWSLCSDLDGVGTAMITSRVMSVPSSAHPRRVANPSRSPRQADFADPLGRMARRTFQVIDVVEVLQHWHAGRPKTVVAASLGVDVKTISSAFLQRAARSTRPHRR